MESCLMAIRTNGSLSTLPMQQDGHHRHPQANDIPKIQKTR
ncbi:MAG: hypothetical protein SPI30_02070 [Prevotella sp.]|nr:hypothetical protein [Prevotella sp.]